MTWNEDQLNLFDGDSEKASVSQVSKLSESWMTSGYWVNGTAGWMHPSSEAPVGIEECSSSLSDILQPHSDSGLEKYFLSARAAEGILRRAGRRGKQLPELLEKALNNVVRQGS